MGGVTGEVLPWQMLLLEVWKFVFGGVVAGCLALEIAVDHPGLECRDVFCART